MKTLNGVDAINLIQKSAETHLNNLVSQVNETDKIIFELQERIFELRNEKFKRIFINSDIAQLLNKIKLDRTMIDPESDPLPDPLFIHEIPERSESPDIFESQDLFEDQKV